MADSEDVKDSAVQKIRNWGGKYNSTTTIELMSWVTE